MMQISVSGQHVEVSDALRGYIEDKASRIERHFDHVVDAHFMLTRERQIYRAEATLHVPRETLFAHAEHDDMYAAIDRLMDKLDVQIRKYKEKLTAHNNHRAGKPSAV